MQQRGGLAAYLPPHWISAGEAIDRLFGLLAGPRWREALTPHVEHERRLRPARMHAVDPGRPTDQAGREVAFHAMRGYEHAAAG